MLHEQEYATPLSFISHNGERQSLIGREVITPTSYNGYLSLMQLHSDQFFAAMRLGLDVQQAMGELALNLTFPETNARIPKGNGEDILLFPGFGGDNLYLSPLFYWLNAKGNKAHFALPRGQTNKIWKSDVDAALNKAFEIFEGNGGRQITGFGHSAGGIILKIASEVAEKEYGRKIFRRVITAGSPLQFPNTSAHEGNRLVTNQALQIMQRDPQGQEMDRLLFSYLPEEADPGELFSIYSPSDPVVLSHHATREDATNIRIRGSHIGMTWNVEVRRKLGELLAA